MFEHVADGLLVTEVTTRKFIYANPAIHRFLGYEPGQLLGRGVADIHPPEDLPRILAEFEALASGAKDLAEAIPCRRQDGGVLFVDIKTMPLVLHGTPCLMAVFRDATDRYVAEEKFRLVFAATPVLMAVTTLEEGRFVEVNRTFAGTLGYTEEELIGRTSVELGIVSSAGQRAKYIQQMKNGSVRNLPVNMRTKSGVRLSGLISAEKLSWPERDLLLTVLVDVTERDKTEAALRDSERRYRHLVETTSDLIYTHDLDGRITTIHHASLAQCGFTPEEVIGRPLSDFMRPDLRQAFQRSI